MPASQPLPVSVVIAAYDEAALLQRALRSVAAQVPRPAAEVIVVDDGSGDETSAVAAKHGAWLVRHDRNLGTAAARNSGVAAATQPWIALLDQDDEWLVTHLAVLWRARRRHVLVAASALRCTAAGCRDRVHGVPGNVPQELTPGRLVFPGNVIPASAAMARREDLVSAGGFRPPDGVDDLDLWLRLLERGTGVVLPEVTVLYHEHERQASLRVQAMQANHIRVAERYADSSWCSEALLERWRGRTDWNNLRTSLRRRRPIEAARIAMRMAVRPQRLIGAVQASRQRRRMKAAAGPTLRAQRPVALQTWDRSDAPSGTTAKRARTS